MFVLIFFVLCLLASDSIGIRHSGRPLQRDGTRSEASILARFLLAQHFVPVRGILHRHPIVISSVTHRRSRPLARVGDDAPVPECPPIKWMSIHESRSPSNSSQKRTMPLFPLNVSYTPYTRVVLNIIEPRYRSMYDDIIFSGSRSFAVCATTKEGQLMETCTVFYLNDIAEVSEKTDGKVKYVGEHFLAGRVKLLKVLNPDVAQSRETYLRVEVEDVVDTDSDVDTSAAEAEVKGLFDEFVLLQERVNEEVRFSKDVTQQLTFNRDTSTGSTDACIGLWGVIALWQEFLKQRVRNASDKAKQQLVQAAREIAANQTSDDQSAAIEKLMAKTQTLTQSSIDDLWMSKSDPHSDEMLALTQSSSHADRLSIFRHILDEHYQRLKAIESLNAMLG